MNRAKGQVIQTSRGVGVRCDKGGSFYIFASGVCPTLLCHRVLVVMGLIPATVSGILKDVATQCSLMEIGWSGEVI